MNISDDLDYEKGSVELTGLPQGIEGNKTEDIEIPEDPAEANICLGCE